MDLIPNNLSLFIASVVAVEYGHCAEQTDGARGTEGAGSTDDGDHAGLKAEAGGGDRCRAALSTQSAAAAAASRHRGATKGRRS